MTTSSYNTTSDSFATTAGEFAKTAEAGMPGSAAATAAASVEGERGQAERNGGAFAPSTPLLGPSTVESATSAAVTLPREKQVGLRDDHSINGLLESLLVADAAKPKSEMAATLHEGPASGTDAVADDLFRNLGTVTPAKAASDDPQANDDSALLAHETMASETAHGAMLEPSEEAVEPSAVVPFAPPQVWVFNIYGPDGQLEPDHGYTMKELAYGGQPIFVGKVDTNPSLDVLIEFTTPGYTFVQTSPFHYDMFAIDPAFFNHESGTQVANPVALELKVTDRTQGGTFFRSMQYYLTNVVEKARDLRWDWGGSVAENSENNTTLGTLTAFNPERNSNISWSIVTGNPAFAISASGNVYIANKSALNYEAGPFQITARATTFDSKTGSAIAFEDKVFTVNVTNVNERPEILGSNVYHGILNWEEKTPFKDGTNRVQFRDEDIVNGPNNDNFTVKVIVDHPEHGTFKNYAAAGWTYDGAGVYTLTGKLADLENAVDNLVFLARHRSDVMPGTAEWTNFSLQLIENTQGGLQVASTQSFAINSFQQNYAPTIGVWSNGWANGGAIDENLGGGAIVGTLQGLDPNQPENASLKYYFDTSANANPHGWFDLAEDGTVRLNTAVDFEATASDPLLHSANGLKWYELKVYVQDPGHENGFGTIKVYINDVNEAPNAPTFSGGVIGEYVGGEVARLSAIDPEGKAVTYGFAEDADANPANLFKITADGIISTVNPNGLDREASGPIHREGGDVFYLVKVVARDADGKTSAVQNVKVLINDLNEIPTNLTLNNGLVVSVVENSTVIGTLRAVDPETPSCTFKFADGSVTDGTFVIDGNQLKILDGAKLNYEAMPNGQKFLNIVLIAVDGAGAESAPQTFTINVTNAPSEPNAAPDNPVLLTDTINETAQIGDIVGLLGATDQDGDIVHFKFADGDADPGSAGLISWDGAFRINEFGQIVVHNPAKIQVTGGATSKTFTYNVVGNDGNNGATAGPVSIIVNNISVPPSQPSAGDGTIQDTAPIGAYVATLFSTDPDGGPVTFWFKWGDGSLHDTSEDGGRFKIAGTQIVVNGSIAVDHTTGFRYDIVAKDSQNTLSAVTNLAITVENLQPGANADPFISIGTANITTTDRAGPLAIFHDLTITDDSASVTVAISFDTRWGKLFFNGTEVTGGMFTVQGTAAQVTQAIQQGLTYDARERPNGHIGDAEVSSFTITVDDNEGGSSMAITAVTVTATVANNPPTGITITGNSIQENCGIGSDAGVLHTADPNLGDIYSYELLDDAGGRFKLVKSGNDWSVVTRNGIDYETAPDLGGGVRGYTIKVRSTDVNDPTSWIERTLNILVTDDGATPANEAPYRPTGAALSNTSIVEHAAAREIGTLTGIDRNGGETFTYAVVNGGAQSAHSHFAISADGTKLVLVDGFDQDFESDDPLLQTAGGGARKYYVVYVNVTDSTGLSNVQRFEIDVVNVQDDDLTPSRPQFSGGVIEETAQDGAEVGTLSANDTDGPGPNPSFWFWYDNGFHDESKDGRFKIVGDKIVVKDHDAIEVTDGSPDTYTYDVVARDTDGHQSPIRNVTITVNNNDAPTMALAVTAVNAADNGPAVQPYLNIDLNDAEDNDLVVTISFAKARGILVGETATGDDGTTLTYTFTGKAAALEQKLNGLFFDATDDSATAGQLATAIDIAVTDSHHPAATAQVTVNTSHGTTTPNNTPLGISLTPHFVAERLAAREVGELATADIDQGETFVYELLDTAGGRFALSADGRKIVTTQQLDFESTDALIKDDYFGRYYALTVRSTDHGGGQGSQAIERTVKVYVTDAMDDPTNAAPVLGGAANPVAIATRDIDFPTPFANVTFTDTDQLTVVIALDDPTDGKFATLGGGSYDEATGVYRIQGDAATVQTAIQHLVFDPTNRPTDAPGTIVSTNFSIMVSDGNSSVRNTNITVNAASTAAGGGTPEVKFSEKFVREHYILGFEVGKLSVEGLNGPLTWRLIDSHNGAVALNGDSITVADVTQIDFEQSPEFKFKVGVRDGTGPEVEKEIKLDVLNIIIERVDGGATADMIRSGSGNDTLKGNGGNDTLAGGRGVDLLTGGNGADVFLFDTQMATSNVDRIMDFKIADGDQIRLDRKMFPGGFTATDAGITLNVNAFALSTATKTAQTRVVYNQTTGEIFFDADGSSATRAPILFAKLDNAGTKPLLTAHDFFIL